MERFDCFLIGADTLLVECGEILLAKGHKILGVISSADAIGSWAASKEIPIYDAQSDYKAALEARPFDYLFSITHLALISAEVLALPRKLAINFHDGPLPRYAGLNAPAWALMNQERTYGITWHVMTAGADLGEILEQRTFDVAPGETSLTLNTRNFEVAMSSFADLADALAGGRVQRRAQDLSSRNYFGRHDRPRQASVLDWARPATELEALVRALDFGARYANPLGFPTIAYRGDVAAVLRAQARPRSEGASTATPGSVIVVNEREIVVATGEGELAITALSKLCGRPLALADVTQRWKLAAGAQLDVLTAERSERLTSLHAALAKGEAFWCKRLARLAPVEIPYAALEGSGTTRVEKVTVPADFASVAGPLARRDALIAAFAAYVARLAGTYTFHLAYTDEDLRAEIDGFTAWASPEVPLAVDFDAGASFEGARASFESERERLRKHKTWMRDLVGRHPELALRADSIGPALLPVGVAVQPSAASFRPPSGRVLTWIASTDGNGAWIAYDQGRLAPDDAAALRRQIESFLQELTRNPARPIAELELLAPEERELVIRGWNRTDEHFPREVCVHQLIEERARKSPDAPAVVCEDGSLSYRELNERANQLAAHLRGLGVRPDSLVGVYLERSLDLVVAIVGVHKAGGAYVPLDPAFPKDRVAYMLEDSRAALLVTQESLAPNLAGTPAKVVRIDSDWSVIANGARVNLAPAAQPENLAYVIYTSGSTGKPKGVMVEHRNVVNFFTGIDARIPHPTPGTWLAVTSLSFDISVLELLWTLARGFQVVLYRDRERSGDAPTASARKKPMDFSLFYFSSDADESSNDKYRLLLEGARFADAHGFVAVWTPERHFHAFGGLYPNPAVTGAAVAAITKNVQIRAGSIVVPLHHPVRIAEAWSIVDNLSNGRAAISIASGWQPNDFLLMPQNYAEAKRVMFESTETVQKLWRGDTVEFPGATGTTVAVRTLPRPVQKELPIWVTTAGNPETYEQAGRIGANVLTHLLGQSIEQLAPKIALYRKARAEAGFDPDAGVVSLMLHTYVGDSDEQVRDIVRQPLKNYLGTSLSLLKQYAWAFPAFQKPKNVAADAAGDEFSQLTPEEHDALLEHAFERYYETSGLFGTQETCIAMVDSLSAIGVDEIACLIDFGVPTDLVLPMLNDLDRVRAEASIPAAGASGDYSVRAQIARHRVTHLQCTPSMMRMLLTDEQNHASLRTLKHVMIGGEAFPIALAQEMGRVLTSATVTNMYGPTETTIWSSTHPVDRSPTSIPIGTPIANTQFYVLDKELRPVPIGVPGELYIGGDGVVRGYFNRAELTAERFVADPFRAGAHAGNARMYKTGDLVRWRRDGTVEFLGRTDFQVKIRGYRIELGEIEAQLSLARNVREAIVLAREDTPGDARLVAYVVADTQRPEIADLREQLRAKLPEYMVPAHFAFLDRMPLTPNGKVDRKALPPPEALEENRAASYVAPENGLETLLLELWQETLGQSKIGVEDNFFDIGGHSLLVVRLHRKLAKMVQQAVSLTDLYRFPTIRSLTDHLSSDGSSEELQKSADRGKARRESLASRRKRKGSPS
ncbi:MAG: MupA/Atu3671 family FMN-dependent luciferase-like monooxygenase [Planctomycetota bacterium]